MNYFVVDSETAIRLGVFVSVLSVLATLESLYPRRHLNHLRGRRWRVNFSVGIFNSLIGRLLLPMAGVAAAILADQPKQLEEEFALGIEGFRDEDSIQLISMLIQPFRK